MKLLVATDAHIFQTPDGKHWCKSIYGYDFWTRYLSVFDDVKIVARVKKVKSIEGKKLLVDGNNVEVYGIPFYQGPKELLLNYLKIQRVLKNVDSDCDAALFRMPSQTAYMTYTNLTKDIPVAGEIVYDMTDDVNQPGQNPIIKILKIITSNRLRNFCKNANGVSYVTKESIQRNFPSRAHLYGESKRYFTTHYSTITLSDEAFTGPRDYKNKKKFNLVLSSVSMNSDRKGEKVLIKLVKLCRDKGYDVSATLIGDGTLRSSFEQLAKDLGISEYIEFTGLLPSSACVREVMMNSDIFVFPTQGEGLPRGIIEAMAIGMPVLSTFVGGIPEIIENKYLFSPDDVEGFANEIMRLIDNPIELNDMSINNYKCSLKFNNAVLQSRRDEFYSKLKKLSEKK